MKELHTRVGKALAFGTPIHGSQVGVYYVISIPKYLLLRILNSLIWEKLGVPDWPASRSLCVIPVSTVLPVDQI